jgi:nitroreductase
MNTQQLIEFLLSRRSIRKYRNEPVPLDLLIKIVDVARYAPSAMNSQPWEFVIVTDQEVKNRLASIYPWRQPLYDAPAGIVVLCNENASPYAEQDCSAATMYILLATHALGLGATWHGVKEKEAKKIREILNVPKDVKPFAIISIGWPNEKPEPGSRKPVEEITHLNRYGNKMKPG